MMLQLVRPKFFAPIHGEARHQRAHADLAESLGVTYYWIFILDNGDVLGVEPDRASIVDKVHAGLTFVDRMGASDVAESANRATVATCPRTAWSWSSPRSTPPTARPSARPTDITRGFGAGDDAVIEETRLKVRQASPSPPPPSSASPRSASSSTSSTTPSPRWLGRRTEQRPLVVPVIVEV